MTELFEPDGPHDWRLAAGGPHTAGLLGAANAAGLLTSSDLHVARRVADLGGEPDESVRLAVALTVRAVRRGSVCLDLSAASRLLADVLPDLDRPDPAAWRAAVLASPLLAAGVLRLDGETDHELLYLDRYHRLEQQVCDDLLARAAQPPPVVQAQRLQAALDLVRDEHLSAEQEAAASGAVGRWTTVLTGGPGTGKTTTVARLLVLLADQAHHAGLRVPSVALAAPTGKAATRLQEAVSDELADLSTRSEEAREAVARVGVPEALTLHRLLGWRPDNATRFRHDRGNRLKHDVVVVDESSMVELTLMARLLEAVRPETRLVLVGDPEQLTSVGAGAVLSDLVAGFAGERSPVAALTHNFRSEEDIKSLAEAVRRGDPDEVVAVLRAPSTQVTWVETVGEAEAQEALREACVSSALQVLTAALDGRPEAALTALDGHRLLCAHREGPWGVRRWNGLVERWLGEQPDVDPVALLRQWYVGRPLLVTSNDYALDVYNGETGVVALVDGPTGPRPRAFVSGSRGVQDFAPGRLDAVETMHATTIHKSQGSQAARVSILLPDADSRLLTRELFYTAVTRAQQVVRVVGSEAAVRAAVLTRADRATGLARRLRVSAP